MSEISALPATIEDVKRHTLSGAAMCKTGFDIRAIIHYRKAYSLVKKFRNYDNHRLCAQNLGAAFLAINDLTRADKYLDRALLLAVQVSFNKRQNNNGSSLSQSQSGSLRCSCTLSVADRNLMAARRQSNGDLFYNIALLNEKKLRFAEAESWYEAALLEYKRLEPSNFDSIALTNEKLARLAERDNRNAISLSYYEAAIKLFETAVNLFTSRADTSPFEAQSKSNNNQSLKFDVQKCVAHAIACYYAALSIVKKTNDSSGKQRLTDGLINFLGIIESCRLRLNLESKMKTPTEQYNSTSSTDFLACLHLGVLYYDVGLFCVENKQIEKALRCLESALEFIRTEGAADETDYEIPLNIGVIENSTSENKRRSKKQNGGVHKNESTQTRQITVRERFEPAIQQNLGALYNAVGDYQRSVSFHERAAALFTRVVNRLADWKSGVASGSRSTSELSKRMKRSVAQTFANLAFACYSLGQIDAAYAAYELALNGARAAQDVRTEWQALEALATLCARANKLDEAVALLQEAVVAVGNDPLASASRARFTTPDGDAVYAEYGKLYGSASASATPTAASKAPADDTYYVQQSEEKSGENRRLVAKLSSLLERVLARKKGSAGADATSLPNDADFGFSIPNRLLLAFHSSFTLFLRRVSEVENIASTLPLHATYSTLRDVEADDLFPFSRWSVDMFRPRFVEIQIRESVMNRVLKSADTLTVSSSDSESESESELLNSIDEGAYLQSSWFKKLETSTILQESHRQAGVKDKEPRRKGDDYEHLADENRDVYETLGTTIYSRILVDNVLPVCTADYGCVTPRAAPARSRSTVSFNDGRSAMDTAPPPLPPRRINLDEVTLVEKASEEDDCVYSTARKETSAHEQQKQPFSESDARNSVIEKEDEDAEEDEEEDEENEPSSAKGQEEVEDEEQDELEEIDPDVLEKLYGDNKNAAEANEKASDPEQAASNAANSCSKSATCTIL